MDRNQFNQSLVYHDKMCHLVVSLSVVLHDIVTTKSSIIISYFFTEIKLCMSVHSVSSLISYLMVFLQLTFGLTAQKLLWNSWSISADTEVARVHLRQLILVACIVSLSERFLDDALIHTQAAGDVAAAYCRLQTAGRSLLASWRGVASSDGQLTKHCS